MLLLEKNTIKKDQVNDMQLDLKFEPSNKKKYKLNNI